MNILAIETATPVCAIGLRSATTEVVRVLDHDRRHTEVLAAGVAELLAELGLRAKDLDRVVVDIGPGLFTGLRVGIATAIGLCEGVGCAGVEVTSLELLAHAAHDLGVRGTVLGAVDGRRGEVFAQSFELDDTVRALEAPAVRTARDLVIEWATNGAAVSFIGDGVQRYLKDFTAVPNATIIDESVPSLHAALELGERRAPSAVLTPMYLREADAVANFSTRSRQ
ncbi:MAG: tRNA (adenosine(37)-N6)-threonylcarbamoyltransferase complex dimerization subunit type 1 TsaB [Acidimicrobiales bacterium]